MSGTIAVGENEDITLDFDATELDPNEYYAELVINNNDPDNPQMIVPVTLDVTVGIHENDKLGVMIYPNPATDMVHVQSDGLIHSVELLNLIGQRIELKQVEGESCQFNTSNLQSGIYIVKIDTEYGVITQKVTVQ